MSSTARGFAVWVQVVFVVWWLGCADGKAFQEAPPKARLKTVLETDREFVQGSAVDPSLLTDGRLSDLQIDLLERLGLVWGFLKYHHPRIAAGELHWDFELFRILPAVLAAEDRAVGLEILTRWVEEIGVPEGCDPCAAAPTEVHLAAPVGWIEDEAFLGSVLSKHLRAVHRFRHAAGEGFYVGLARHVGNPVFEHELAYEHLTAPDLGYRLLALLRLWNIVEYWFPYRDLVAGGWRPVLREFLPRFAEAEGADAYRLELLALIARIEDTHANLWSALDLRPPRGECRWPVRLRFVEDRFVVTDTLAVDAALQVGDVIEAVGGRPVTEWVEEWSPYYAASNEVTRRRDIARQLSRGPCGESMARIVRHGEGKTLSLERVDLPEDRRITHDRAGDTFQRLSDEVAYLKLSSVQQSEVDRYLEQAAGTRGLVIDIRNYPSEFMVFALGQRLIDEPTPFARFTSGDLDNPGAFLWGPVVSLSPQTPAYGGKVAVLVDESSISQAEYTAMALSAGPRAVVVGSTTAGADGNVSQIPLPGGEQTMISGIGVFYPDKTPTQQIGIVPDIVATPTVEGIREGRDEVLEAALRHLLGPEADEAAIRRMAVAPLDPPDSLVQLKD